MEKVAAVVLTHNRKEYLVECINALLDQSIKLEKIYIIDNASTDGTYDKLKECNILQYENVVYKRLEINIGSAGGFKFGIELAHKGDFDWVWIMDDDIVPVRNGLEKMLKYKNISNFIMPSKITEEGFKYNNAIYFDIRTGLGYKYHKSLNEIGKNYWFVNYGCFEGLLINNKLINKIGYPDEEFFINYDDTYYGIKAYYYDNPIIIDEIVFIKKLMPKTKNIFGKIIFLESDFKIFYRIRNLFLLQNKVKNFLRNHGEDLKINYYNLIFRDTLKTLIKIILFEDNKIRKIYILFKAFFNGIFLKFEN